MDGNCLKGWENDKVNSIHIFVETIHYFRGIDTAYTNVIDIGSYNITVGSDSYIGDVDSPRIEGLPKAEALRTPGFEVVMLL